MPFGHFGDETTFAPNWVHVLQDPFPEKKRGSDEPAGIRTRVWGFLPNFRDFTPFGQVFFLLGNLHLFLKERERTEVPQDVLTTPRALCVVYIFLYGAY